MDIDHDTDSPGGDADGLPSGARVVEPVDPFAGVSVLDEVDWGDLLAEAGGLISADPGEMPDEAARVHALKLRRLAAQLDAAVVATTGVVARRGLHAADGMRSAAGWLAGRVEITRHQARAEIDLNVALDGMPLVAAAFREGRLGRQKAERLAEVRTPELVELFAACEEMLVEEVVRLRLDECFRYLRAWQEQARISVAWRDPDESGSSGSDDADDPGSGGPVAAAHMSSTFGGRWVLDAEFDPVTGAEIRSAIDAEVDAMFRAGVFTADDELSAAEHRGRALVQVITRKARAGEKQGQQRPSVEVLCDEHTLLGQPVTDPAEDGGDDLRSRVCELVDGTPVSEPTFDRILCNADIHRLVTTAESEVLDAGKTIRHASAAQRRALRLRHDRHCGFPGCEAPFDWCEMHHIVHWNPDPDDPSGGTDLSNLVPLCRFHHHQVHEGGFRIELDDRGHATVSRPGRDRCRTTPVLAHRPTIARHPDTRLVRQRVRALIDRTAGASPPRGGSVADGRNRATT